MRRESGQSQAASPQESRNPPPIHSHFRRDPVVAGCYLFSGRDLVLRTTASGPEAALAATTLLGSFALQVGHIQSGDRSEKPSIARDPSIPAGARVELEKQSAQLSTNYGLAVTRPSA